MIVTSTDFKMNLGRYLDMVTQEEIVITKNGHRVAKLISDDEDLVAVAKSLFGILPPDVSYEDIKEERMRSRYGIEFND